MYRIAILWLRFCFDSVIMYPPKKVGADSFSNCDELSPADLIESFQMEEPWLIRTNFRERSGFGIAAHDAFDRRSTRKPKLALDQR